MNARRVKPGEPEQTFEQLLELIEARLAKLEEGELPLEESLKAYEEGFRALREAHAMLRAAHGRIEMLAETADGAELAEYDPETGTAKGKRRRVKKDGEDTPDSAEAGDSGLFT